MDYSAALLTVFGMLGAAALGFYLLHLRRRRNLLKKIASIDFSDAYREILSKTSYYPLLPPDDREKLERSILRFIYTKHFVGIGLTVTEEMKAVIAFYACLLLLHRGDDDCYGNLKTIIVYPDAVVINQVKSEGGIYSEETLAIDGQSADDTVVITWAEASDEAYRLQESNVIIHEFAHVIDFMDGEIDGVPPMERSHHARWEETLYREFDALDAVVSQEGELGRYTLFGTYAAEDEAEFFAVLTERFFGSPAALKRLFPELYAMVEEYYRIDPAALLEETQG